MANEVVDLESVIGEAISDISEGDGDGNEPEVSEVETSEEGDGHEEVEEAPESSEKGDEGDEGEGSPDPKKSPEKPAEGEDDPFAAEHGLKAKDKSGRENRIPYSRVVKITANAKRKLLESAGITVPTDADDTKLAETLKTTLDRVPTLETEIGEYKTTIETMNKVGEIMEHDPERFLQILREANPRYAELIKGGVATEPKPGAVPADADMPAPDLDLGNGQSTYSPKGLTALLAWHAAQVKKAVLDDVHKDIEPITAERKSREFLKAGAERAQAQVEHARANWPGFKEHEAEILQTLQTDSAEAKRLRRPMISFHEAYIKVVNTKHTAELENLKTDRQKMRDEILAEQKKTVTSTSAGGVTTAGKVAQKPGNGDDPVTAAIKQSIAGLPRT